LNVLDTAPEDRFDDITKLCCMIFKVPIALVSLVDKERQWFKSVQGLATNFTDRKSSFCAWTLLPEHPEVLVVEDATQDARFANNALVTGPPDIRFYAGTPLVASNGMRLGSLCIIDRASRRFDAESCMLLANMGEMVVREIEKESLLEEQKKKSAQLTVENTQLLRAIDAFNEGIVLCDVSEPNWPIVFINEAWENLTQFAKNNVGRGFWEFFQVPDSDVQRVHQGYTEAIAEQRAFDLSVFFMDSASGAKRWMTLSMRCANAENMDTYMPLVGIPSILTAEPEEGGDQGPVYYFATLLPAQVSQPGAPAAAPTGNSSSFHTITSSTQNTLFSAVSNKDPFDDVKLGQLLGKGSYGRVYRAQWNGAQVAVKVLETVHEDDEVVTNNMEALLSNRLQHPNVVSTYKYCSRPISSAHQHNTIIETWMVMEFCNKGSLSDGVDRGWFRKKGSLFEADYAAYVETAKEMAAAMCYLHAAGILHGDLTGNNILLTGSEKDARGFQAKVADFGLSRVLDGRDAIQTTSYGTVTHMPPELLLDGKMSKAGDVYAYGVILWEMFMGQRPWSGLSHGQIIQAITTNKQLALGSSCPTVLRKFIYRCISPKPEERPSFDQVVKDLEEVEDELVGTS